VTSVDDDDGASSLAEEVPERRFGHLDGRRRSLRLAAYPMFADFSELWLVNLLLRIHHSRQKH
jgi:hypothetical protein